MEEHFSYTKEFLWYIDSFKEEKTQFVFSGWVCSFLNVINDLILEDLNLNVFFYERKDVIEFYPSIKGKYHGFTLNIDKKDIFKDIYASVGTFKYKLGNLAKWVTFYSGYNNYKKDLVVVENFYKNPDLVRKYALENLDYTPSDYHKGQRSKTRFILDGTKEKLEDILGKEIINWNHQEYANGIFQYCTADQPIVYHVDSQTMAAIVFLTPNAPLNTGTSFFKSLYTGEYSFDDATAENDLYFRSFTGPYNKEFNFYDSTLHEKVDEVGNVYNRLVIWDAKKIHAATRYFGDSLENARFFHLFFFDVK